MAFQPTPLEEEKKKTAAKPAVKPAQEKLAEQKIVLEEEKIYRAGAATVRDLIAPAAMKIEPSFVRLGDTFARTIFVVTYPRYIGVGWAAPIINFNWTMDMGMSCSFWAVPSGEVEYWGNGRVSPSSSSTRAEIWL